MLCFYVSLCLIAGIACSCLQTFVTAQVAPTGFAQPAVHFNFPIFQAAVLMAGRATCIIAHYSLTSKVEITRNRDFPRIIASMPALCAWIGTIMVNVSCVIIPVAAVQMCRGCAVVFTCLFSQVFLGRKQEAHHILGVALVASGMIILGIQGVGDANAIHPPHWKDNHLEFSTRTGLLVCLTGEVFLALMWVFEEKYLQTYLLSPLHLVGLEGLFGAVLGIPVLLWTQQAAYESASEAIYAFRYSTEIQVGCALMMMSVAVSAWSGVAVTREASATTRATIEALRLALLWTGEPIRWNGFALLHLSGFILVLCGTMLYNGVLDALWDFSWVRKQDTRPREESRLLA